MISIHVENNQLSVIGSVTFANVNELTKAGMIVMTQAEPVVNLAKVTELDSSAVSMLLAWLRTAQQHGHSLRLVNLPQNLASLIKLYDLTELIPFESNCQTD
ncbi:MAG: STAS domain-containing protein [Nitrosomonas sp.]|nr:STAS domain-containing protein [Nitrosomonas sp.]